MPSILYSVSMPDPDYLSENFIEVRGALGCKSGHKYPHEALTLMSQLFRE